MSQHLKFKTDNFESVIRTNRIKPLHENLCNSNEHSKILLEAYTVWHLIFSNFLWLTAFQIFSISQQLWYKTNIIVRRKRECLRFWKRPHRRRISGMYNV